MMFIKNKLCDACKKNIATNFYKEVVNGHKIEVCLCNKCAANENAFEDAYSVFLSPMFGDLFTTNSIYDAKPKIEKVCKCGCRESDIVRTGRFGCSECYKTFSDIVDKYIAKLGGHTYAGQMPSHIIKEGTKPLTIQDQIKELRLKMEDAASNQDYLLAQKYQTQIKELQKKLEN